jgi:DNA oxidative demethylase
MNPLPAGCRHLAAHFDRDQQHRLLAAVRDVIATAQLYTPTMPRTGKPLSVVMTNCGVLGWVTDRDGGYRYQPTHPVTGQPWPAIPAMLIDLWHQVADFPAEPEACLINVYRAGTRMGSHVDRDEADFTAPVVSVSLGDAATFHVGGAKRGDPKMRLRLASGDVVVLGGASRLAHHGIDRIFAGTSDLLVEGGRINLTLRRVTVPAKSCITHCITT